MNHTLSLNIPDIRNTCIINISDTSVYDGDCMNVQCPILQITPPGYQIPTDFDVTAGWANLNITACDLGTQTENCGTSFTDIPDGIYVIRYSVSPNEEVYVEYNHLRMANALEDYYNALCELNLAGCQPNKEVNATLNKLSEIKTMFDAAKATVEYCHNPIRGMEIFTYAKAQLAKITCKYC
jgi:hypothetical protein